MPLSGRTRGILITPSNVLAIGAHPDDIEIGCGGTLCKHLESGDKVYLLIMTNGEAGMHSADKEECLHSLSILGIDTSRIIFGNFQDGSLSDNKETVTFIEQVIRKYDIDRIYTHDPRDRHQDHRNCSRAVSSAARKVPRIFLYQGPSTLVTFEPHYFIGITEQQLKRKSEALTEYGSQIGKGILSIDWVNSIAKVNGIICNTRYAEAFAINHIFEEAE